MNYVTRKCWAEDINSAVVVLEDLGVDAACPVAGGVKEEAMFS